jgi:hypothetical protein
MYQKDYILRMIEMLGDLIAGILGLIKKGEYYQASEQLGKIYYDMLKEDAAFFRNIPGNELTNKLLNDHNYTNGHLEILAELLYAESELGFAQGNKTGCLEYSKKSLLLFEFIDVQQRTYTPDRIKKMKILKERIRDCSCYL